MLLFDMVYFDPIPASASASASGRGPARRLNGSSTVQRAVSSVDLGGSGKPSVVGLLSAPACSKKMTIFSPIYQRHLLDCLDVGAAVSRLDRQAAFLAIPRRQPHLFLSAIPRAAEHTEPSHRPPQGSRFLALFHPSFALVFWFIGIEFCTLSAGERETRANYTPIRWDSGRKDYSCRCYGPCKRMN